MSNKRCIEIKSVVIGNDVEGYALKSTPISFLGDVDKDTGRIIAIDNPACGEVLKDKILVMERTRGSTVSTYVLYALYKRGLAPKAIILSKVDPVLLAGAILCDITFVYDIPRDFIDWIRTGDFVEIKSSEGIVRVCREEEL